MKMSFVLTFRMAGEHFGTFRCFNGADVNSPLLCELMQDDCGTLKNALKNKLFIGAFFGLKQAMFSVFWNI